MQNRMRAPLAFGVIAVAGAAFAVAAVKRPAPTTDGADHAARNLQSQQITVYRTPG